MNQPANNIIEVSDATFDRDVVARSYETPVVVDFWAPWCGPCRMLGPLLERLANAPNSGFLLAKVNVDDNQDLARYYGVQGIPAVKGFRDGQVVAQFVGAQPEPMVRRFLETLRPDEAAAALTQANELLQQHQWASAAGAFRAILANDDPAQAARLGLARALLAQGEGCQAEQQLALLNDLSFVDQVEKLQPLARFLCQAAGSPAGDQEPPLDAQYRHAARLIARGNVAAAMDGLLDILRADKRYRQGEPRLVLLGLFELLGHGDPLVSQYRTEMAMVLY